MSTIGCNTDYDRWMQASFAAVFNAPSSTTATTSVQHVSNNIHPQTSTHSTKEEASQFDLSTEPSLNEKLFMPRSNTAQKRHEARELRKAQRQRLHWGPKTDLSYIPPAPENTVQESIEDLLFKTGVPREALPRMVNVVTSCDVECVLDMKVCACSMRNAEYNPKRFPATIVRLRNPAVTGLIFSTGRLVCLGAKSVAEARLSARKFVRMLQKLGFGAQFKNFTVQNLVAAVKTGFNIRNEGIAASHHHYARYEPELFPGLVYTVCKLRVKAMIFTSGKVILTGAKCEQHTNQVLAMLWPILNEYKVVDSYETRVPGYPSLHVRQNNKYVQPLQV
jgi:transcription initiation factor TFIID TATA-box-binding protein